MKDYRPRRRDPQPRYKTKKDGSQNHRIVHSLGNKPLFFKNDMQPRARYLYYLFVYDQLKLAWRPFMANPLETVAMGQLSGSTRVR